MRRLATVLVVALVGATCLGLAWDSGGTGERGNATVVSAAHHHTSASIHLDGVAAFAAVAFAAGLWATERLARLRVHTPAATSLVRRRGPPFFPAH